MKPWNCCEICRAVIDDSETFCHRCESRRISRKVVNVCGWLLVACVVIAIYGPKGCAAAEITEADMHRIMLRESGGNPKAKGRAGELGKYQLKACAVAEVNRLTGTKWKHRHALDPELSEHIAYAYMRICLSRAKIKTADGAYRVYRGLR